MPGRIQFDKDKALQEAGLLFWRKGYVATSMADIKAATGIKESSLYNTFGSKKELFMETLCAYSENVKQQLAALPVEEQPADSIRMLLRQIASRAKDEDQAIGCMLMNSALELGAEHRDIVDFVKARYGEIEAWFLYAVRHAQGMGEIPKDKDAERLARFLTYSLQSIFTVARAKPTDEFIDDVCEMTLSLLD